MNKKKLIIILSVVALVLLGLLLALILTRDPEPPVLPEPISQNGDNTQNITPQPELPSVIQNSNPVSANNPLENAILSASRNFAERFGTYSSDNQFSNLKEAKVFASARMSAELDRMIQGNPVSETFVGVTSKVLNLKIVDPDDGQGSAKVTATMQREETREGQEPKIYYQNLEMDLIASGNNWLVDRIAWK